MDNFRSTRYEITKSTKHEILNPKQTCLTTVKIQMIKIQNVLVIRKFEF